MCLYTGIVIVALVLVLVRGEKQEDSREMRDERGEERQEKER